jgi:hypothetical protein
MDVRAGHFIEAGLLHGLNGEVGVADLIFGPSRLRHRLPASPFGIRAKKINLTPF